MGSGVYTEWHRMISAELVNSKELLNIGPGEAGFELIQSYAYENIPGALSIDNWSLNLNDTDSNIDLYAWILELI